MQLMFKTRDFRVDLVKAVRTILRLRHKDMAEVLGISRVAYSEAERRKISFSSERYHTLSNFLIGEIKKQVKELHSFKEHIKSIDSNDLSATTRKLLEIRQTHLTKAGIPQSEVSRAENRQGGYRPEQQEKVRLLFLVEKWDRLNAIDSHLGFLHTLAAQLLSFQEG